MNCKFCNAELPEEVTLCPACGKENTEEVTQEVSAVENEEIVEAAEEVTEEAAEEIIEESTEELTEESSEEATEEAEEEVPAKPKRKLWLRILAAVCGVAILAVLIGSVFYGTNTTGKKAVSYSVSDAKAQQAKDTVVATAGEETLTNSELQVYYWQGVNDFYNYISYYMDVTMLNLDLSKPLDQQFYNEEEGITWQQHFLDSAFSTWHRYASLSNLAKSEGFQMSEELAAQLNDIPNQLEEMAVAYGYESASDMLFKDMGAACDMDGYMRFMTTNFYVSQFMESKSAQLKPTLEELEAYYAENEEAVMAMGIENDGSLYVDVRHILLTPESETLNEETGEMVITEADWETCRQKAQALLDQWLAGERTEESFTQLAAQYNQDPGSQSTGGLYTNVTQGQMAEAFDKWCFDESRKPGDSGLVQTNYGYHIMYFVKSQPTWVADLTSQLVNERSTEMVNNAVAQYPIETNLKKVVLSNTTAE